MDAFGAKNRRSDCYSLVIDHDRWSDAWSGESVRQKVTRDESMQFAVRDKLTT